MKKILSIFGTRPEAIKMASVIKGLESCPEKFQSRVCVTAQHRYMLDQVLDLFEIKPDFDLDLMKSGQDLFDVSCWVLQGLKKILQREKPDMVLVHGDTTTTMAAALAAFYCKIPVAHVEAGLRTYDKYSPFPEEINRKIASSVTDIHFAPTEKSRTNLLHEGVPSSAVIVTGNTVIDSLLWVLEKIGRDRPLQLRCEKKFSFLDAGKRCILATCHRRENFGEGITRVCQALKCIVQSNPGVEVVYPVHLNPKVQKPVRRILGQCSSIHLIEPLSYQEFVWLMQRSYLIMTDSGGVQEEAPSLGKPVLVLRQVSERPEAVNAGTVSLVGTDEKLIVAAANDLLNDGEKYKEMSQAHNPYGDGKAVKRILSALQACDFREFD